MRTEALKRSTVKLFAVVRMSYADKELGTFLHRLAVEIHCSELCHYIMYMRPGGYDSATLDDNRSDFAATLIGGRRHCDYGLTLRREGGSVDEVHLSAYS